MKIKQIDFIGAGEELIMSYTVEPRYKEVRYNKTLL